MRCEHTREMIDRAYIEGADSLDKLVYEHLARCPECNHYGVEVQTRALLSDLTIPGPRPGFADEVIDIAWATRHGQSNGRRRATAKVLALAASLVLAISVVFQTPWRSSDPARPALAELAATTPHSVRQVDLLMESASALPDAVITVRLDDHVRLVGYPGDNSISWHAPIGAGNNQLTLPVQLQGDKRGVILLEIVSDDFRKEMALAVDKSGGRPIESRSI